MTKETKQSISDDASYVLINSLITSFVQIFINMAFCCLFVLGKMIQKMVFGELRISEHHSLKDKFWNFVFYKFIFVFGVVNVQFMHEVRKLHDFIQIYFIRSIFVCHLTMSYLYDCRLYYGYLGLQFLVF